MTQVLHCRYYYLTGKIFLHAIISVDNIGNDIDYWKIRQLRNPQSLKFLLGRAQTFPLCNAWWPYWPVLWVWVYGAAVYSCVDHHHCDHARVSTCPWTCCDLPPDTGATKIVVCAVHCYQCECCGEYVMWRLHYKLMDVQCSPCFKYFISSVLLLNNIN